MLFTSLEFLIFLVSTLLVYYSVPTKKMQLITVTIASYISTFALEP